MRTDSSLQTSARGICRGGSKFVVGVGRGSAFFPVGITGTYASVASCSARRAELCHRRPVELPSSSSKNSIAISRTCFRQSLVSQVRAGRSPFRSVCAPIERKAVVAVRDLCSFGNSESRAGRQCQVGIGAVFAVRVGQVDRLRGRGLSAVFYLHRQHSGAVRRSPEAPSARGDLRHRSRTVERRSRPAPRTGPPKWQQRNMSSRRVLPPVCFLGCFPACPPGPRRGAGCPPPSAIPLTRRWTVVTVFLAATTLFLRGDCAIFARSGRVRAR